MEQIYLNGITDPHILKRSGFFSDHWVAQNENQKGAPMPVHPLITFDTAQQNQMINILCAPREHAAAMLDVIQERLAEAQSAFFRMYYSN